MLLKKASVRRAAFQRQQCKPLLAQLGAANARSRDKLLRLKMHPQTKVLGLSFASFVSFAVKSCLLGVLYG